jgi:hypothetical protein
VAIGLVVAFLYFARDSQSCSHRRSAGFAGYDIGRVLITLLATLGFAAIIAQEISMLGA